jgi:NAD+ synthase (glutamine-hydrolysing)
MTTKKASTRESQLKIKTNRLPPGSVRVALAQINSCLGDFKKNAEKIIEFIHRAKAKHCDLVVFPESCLYGYPAFDLLERKKSVDLQLKELHSLQKKMPKGIVAIVGCITKNPKSLGAPFFNSAAILDRSQPQINFIHKTLLPTGDVFDESRFYEPGQLGQNKKSNIIKLANSKILVTICEDIWGYPDLEGKNAHSINPLKMASTQIEKINLVINISASPFFIGKKQDRLRVLKETIKLFKAPMVYVNSIGAQDEIIFDGQSLALDKQGNIIGQSLAFEEDLNVVDFNTQESGIRPEIESEAELLRQALVLGIRDFCSKNNLDKIHLGLSGGIDSALVACLAVDALGPGKVSTVALPGPFSAPESESLAKKLATHLGVKFKTISINSIYETVSKVIDDTLDLKNFSLVHENIQARIRGLLLMAISNLENSLLLTTSNKSELATGYCTLYGDMCGGLAPIADLTKGQVYKLAKLYNIESEIIPKAIITRPPTAELRPNQKDQDTLPPYDQLDKTVRNLVEIGKSPKNSSEEWVLSALFKSEFKRWQAPPILKISRHAFGRGRRWPLAHKVRV